MPTFSPLSFCQTSRRRSRIVFLQTGWDDRILNGVARYADEHALALDADMRWTNDLPKIPATDRAGIIAQIGTSSRRNELLRYLETSAFPIVDIQGDKSLDGIPKVTLNVNSIAGIAVSHFTQRGFSQITCVATEESFFERRLFAAVSAAAQTSESQIVHFRDLADFLKSQVGPVALFTANDPGASSVIRVCREAGREVPDDVVVLGTGNNELLCGAGPVSISSIDCDLEGQGYAAAKILHALLDKKPLPSMTVSIAARSVCQRCSTDSVAIPDPQTARALRYLRGNYTRPIEQGDIYEAIGSSVQRISRYFKKHVGSTMAQELMRLRVERACVLLTDEKLKLVEVAKLCGFSDRYRFERAFCRLQGCTPWNYRQRLRHPFDVGSASQPSLHRA